MGSISKTYDGTSVATLTPSNFLLFGFVNGNGASVAQTTGTFASVEAGTRIVVSTTLSAADFLANPGTDLSNYVLPTSAVGAIGTILAAPLTITYVASPARRTYGQSNSLLTGTVIASGLVGPDVLSTVTSGRAAFTSTADLTSNGGNYAVTGSGLIGASRNYTYTFTQASANFSALAVTPASLIVYYVADQAQRRVGQAVGTLSGSTLAIGLVNGDALGSVTSGTAVFATNATAASGPGNYAITGSGLNGASANYAIRFLQAPSNSFGYSVLRAPRSGAGRI